MYGLSAANRWLYHLRNRNFQLRNNVLPKIKNSNSEMQICGFNWLQKEGNMNYRSEWM